MSGRRPGWGADDLIQLQQERDGHQPLGCEPQATRPPGCGTIIHCVLSSGGCGLTDATSAGGAFCP